MENSDVEKNVKPMEDAAPLPTNLRRTVRLALLFSLNVYIVAHIILWYGFDIQPWGKTAMTGVPALVRGNINIAAVMVFLILVSVFFFGRAFCGWGCHLRGIIEFADWTMRKLQMQGYMKLRRRNILINTRYAWLIRGGAFTILLMPVLVYLTNNPFSIAVDLGSPPPWTDMPGDRGQLFASHAPINMALTYTLGEIAFLIALSLVIIATATFVFTYFYGQAAFCRILCPYAFLLALFMNLNPFQRKITRTGDCTGCRKCATNCPQGIDVSREIHHYNGKVRNRECVKCFTCVDVCDAKILKDTWKPAAPQIAPRREYERKPWHNEFHHVQSIEPIDPVLDFISMLLALFSGVLASRFGGFWFFVGFIVGFMLIRLLLRYGIHWVKSRPLVPSSK
ncbi:MAG: 4Fe-4S binding protein [Magnetospirillum sp. WYHS-4]